MRSAELKSSKLSVIKVYLWGFIKGAALQFGIPLIIATFYLVPLQLTSPNILTINNSLDFDKITPGTRIVFWLISWGVADFMVLKHKLPKVWFLIALFIGPFALPFMLGNIEINKFKKLP